MTDYINQDRNQHTNGLLSLICGTEGVGAIAGPKLYKKFGFEFISDIGNGIALFYDEQYCVDSHKIRMIIVTMSIVFFLFDTIKF